MPRWGEEATESSSGAARPCLVGEGERHQISPRWLEPDMELSQGHVLWNLQWSGPGLHRQGRRPKQTLKLASKAGLGTAESVELV